MIKADTKSPVQVPHAAAFKINTKRKDFKIENIQTIPWAIWSNIIRLLIPEYRLTFIKLEYVIPIWELIVYGVAPLLGPGKVRRSRTL